MPRLKVQRRQVYAQRFTKIPQLLSDIVTNPDRLGCKQVPGRNEYTIGAYDGSTPPNFDYRDWRFRTLNSELRANYFEIWRPADSQQSEWFLFRAYLTLFRINPASADEDEIVALHCDPAEPDAEPHVEYKRGPHLHMLTADDPLHHSHIALNNPRYLDSHVLTSFEAFTDHLNDAMKFISEQVIKLYD